MGDVELVAVAVAHVCGSSQLAVVEVEMSELGESRRGEDGVDEGSSSAVRVALCTP